MFSAEVTLTRSEFHRVGAVTKKALVPTFALNMEQKVD